jgi:phosphoadenosine phosphosulfate reductase
VSPKTQSPRASNPTAVAAARDLLSCAAEQYRGAVAFATSLGIEDQVITDMIASADLAIPVFTLDTGRLPQETHDLIDRTEQRYGIRIHIYHPESNDIEALVNFHGVNCFYTSIELRRRCCHVRKTVPLRRALEGKRAWICGLRRGQAVTRSDIKDIEWDEANGLTRYCPLADWSDEEAWAYAREHSVPYSALHDRGFPSIGCAPCTRAVADGNDVRSGRWWWESPEHKECGLHARYKNA